MRRWFLCFIILSILAICFGTVLSLQSFRDRPLELVSTVQRAQILDRNGRVLSSSYQNEWNLSDHRALHEMPDLIKKAFIMSEDRRFFEHVGIDWKARGKALIQNLRQRRAVRGASTISEQVVKLIHPLPRTLWSRWVEGLEAIILERGATKSEILEFYLNQVPYGRNRRGVVQAARLYFDRDLETLNQREMLALVVLVRGPSVLDPFRHPEKLNTAIEKLARNLPQDVVSNLAEDRLELSRGGMPIEAPHFVSYVREIIANSHHLKRIPSVRTTLDAQLQVKTQALLDRQVTQLNRKHVENGGAIVIDHQTGEIIAWAVAGNGRESVSGAQFDTVRVPRQPGSTLKPFLYALALEKGWTPATMIDDSPLGGAVGHGLHLFRNYSRTHYGPVSLRAALGNSLNVPAVRTIQFIGVGRYLDFLRQLGFATLKENADFYGDGLALGNGEVSLFELAQAYTALPGRGTWRPARVILENENNEARLLLREDVASLLGNILSDPYARRLEFGSNSFLNFPVQTAVKTGTSTDYRDAWAVGYNDDFLAAVWLGNLRREPMIEVTGASGAGLVLRAIFAELNRRKDTRPLYLSPRLVPRSVCELKGNVRLADEHCLAREEWFVPGTESSLSDVPLRSYRLSQPVPGLQIALDPRVPQALQAFEFKIEGVAEGERVQWNLDGKSFESKLGRFSWPVEQGRHKLNAVVYRGDREVFRASQVAFDVRQPIP